jgi:hypothetical protein
VRHRDEVFIKQLGVNFHSVYAQLDVLRPLVMSLFVQTG